MVGLLHMAAVGLVVAGATKVRNPLPTVAALVAARLPGARWLVLPLGIIEIAVGIAVLMLGGPATAGAIAIMYAGFAGFIALTLRRNGAGARCGCFGESDAPPSVMHVVVNSGIAVSAAWLAVAGAPSLAEVVVDQPGAGLPYVVLVGVGAAALFLLLDRLPHLQAAARGELGAAR